MHMKGVHTADGDAGTHACEAGLAGCIQADCTFIGRPSLGTRDCETSRTCNKPDWLHFVHTLSKSCRSSWQREWGHCDSGGLVSKREQADSAAAMWSSTTAASVCDDQKLYKGKYE